MQYVVLIITAIMTFGGGISAFVIGIVLAFKRHWWKTLFAACAMMLCIVFCTAAITGLLVKGGSDVGRVIKSNEVAFEGRQTARNNARKAFTPGIDWTKVDDQFWNYGGFRDWFRVPLRWPFEVDSIDTMDAGNLAMNISGGKSELGNSQTEPVQQTFNMIAYAWDANIIVFHRTYNGKDTWGWMDFDSRNLKIFNTEKEMWAWAKDHGWSHAETLKSAKQNYDEYWNS